MSASSSVSPKPLIPPPPPAGGAADLLPRRKLPLAEMFNRFLSPDLDVEVRRQSQLFLVFSLQGMVFGLLFAAFYMAIGHWWGADIVLVCTLALGGAPWIVRAVGVGSAGNFYAFVLVLGFTGLTAIEGGIHGHAVAWLAVVPLCACILVDQRMGRVWCVVCLAVMGVFCALDFAGVNLQPLYAPRWESVITASGYLTLTLFMCLIGVFFERGRRRSLEKLNAALAALSTANDQLHALDKERRAFLSIAAHDLRSPLNAIMGFAQLIQQLNPLSDPMQSDALVRIYNGGTQMRDLLDRLLSVQAIEEGRFNLYMTRCDLVQLASSVVENHRPAATKKSIVLVLKPAAESLSAEADANATIQILDNLLSNAIKFSPLSRPVTVHVLPAAGGVSIEVQDAGPGLSEEDQRNLYGKFVKLSARPTAGESSNGLGLSIVKRLAEAMDGQLVCRSKLGEGTTFSLTLKASATPVPTTHNEPL